MRSVGPALPSLRGGLTVPLLVRAPVLVLLGRPAVPLTPTPSLLELAMTLGFLPILNTRLLSLIQTLVLVGVMLAMLVVLVRLTLLVLLWLALLLVVLVLSLLMMLTLLAVLTLLLVLLASLVLLGPLFALELL